MPDDNLLDILDRVSSRLNLSIELMLWLISDSGEDVGQLRAPYSWIVLATASLPENETFNGVLDQDAVHGQLATLVDEGLVLGAIEGCVAAADHEALVCF